MNPITAATTRAITGPIATPEASGGGAVAWADLAIHRWDVDADSGDPMTDQIGSADINPSSTTYRAALSGIGHATMANRWMGTTGRFEAHATTDTFTDIGVVAAWGRLSNYAATRLLMRRSNTGQTGCHVASDNTTVTIWNGARNATFNNGYDLEVAQYKWQTIGILTTADSMRLQQNGVEIPAATEDYSGLAASSGPAGMWGSSASGGRDAIGEIIVFDATDTDACMAAMADAHTYLKEKWIDTDGL